MAKRVLVSLERGLNISQVSDFQIQKTKEEVVAVL